MLTPIEFQRELLDQTSKAIDRTRVTDDRVEDAISVEVGHTPNEVIYRENKLVLRRYAPAPDADPNGVPILLVYALINRPYILDLQPDRSVINTLRRHGFPVYLIDWGEPSHLDAGLELRDYVDRYIHNCVIEATRDAGVSAIHLLGYCMGGTMACIYAARNPDRVRTLGLLAAGLAFDETGGVLEQWGGGFTPEKLAATYGNVPADFLAGGFAMMDPVTNLVGKYARLYDHLEDEDFVENFARMERWLAEGIDVPGAAYEEFVEEIYQRNALASGTLTLDGDPVDLDRIRMPVAHIVGHYDHLIPPEASTAINESIPSTDVSVFDAPTGHIGLSVSSTSHEQLWPEVCAWFGARSDGAPDLERIDGIGGCYASRLAATGITTVAALAEAEPASIANAVEVGESRAAQWIEVASDVAG